MPFFFVTLNNCLKSVFLGKGVLQISFLPFIEVLRHKEVKKAIVQLLFTSLLLEQPRQFICTPPSHSVLTIRREGTTFNNTLLQLDHFKRLQTNAEVGERHLRYIPDSEYNLMLRKLGQNQKLDQSNYENKVIFRTTDQTLKFIFLKLNY